MRKEYDFSKAERGKFFGKVDTKNPSVETDEAPLNEVFADELDFLESNLTRIEKLKMRLPELEENAREEISNRLDSSETYRGELKGFP